MTTVYTAIFQGPGAPSVITALRVDELAEKMAEVGQRHGVNERFTQDMKRLQTGEGGFGVKALMNNLRGNLYGTTIKVLVNNFDDEGRTIQ